uniref:Amidohydrolase-related domain-containing protein n=1 Tax=Panagrolaimus sp. JU765 TaxID=591449 RepID=A0AC34QJK4_9BILA
MFQSFDYRKKVISPKFIWLNGKFTSNQQLKIGENGEILEIGENLDMDGCDSVELRDSAIVPGFVNAHSHAFHRYLRGQTGIGQSTTDSFWKWRDAMYALVQNIEYDEFKQLCKGTFEEMLSAGITTVGEFHYVHHGSERFELDKAVIEAAEETGIRLVLIETLYMRSGFDSTVVEAKQARFGTDLEEFIENLNKLEKICSKKTTLAVAAHSTRAVDPESIQELWNYAKKHNKAFHIHLEEQPKEIEDCMNSVHRLCPSELLLDKVSSPRQNLTAVHCTFTQRPELNELYKSGGKICVCPLTEGFLGDGIPQINEHDKICLGTDCNNRISFLEEMRWLTYCQNMKHNKRNVAGLDSKKLLQIATINGAESLYLHNSVGQFKPGYQLDFVAFNINNDNLQKFATEDQLLDAIIFGCGNREIQAVGVGGVGHFY